MTRRRERVRRTPHDVSPGWFLGALALGLAGCPSSPVPDAGDARADAHDAAADTGMDAATDGAVNDPVPSMVTRIVACGAVCSRPSDAVLNAAGTTVFFTALDATGRGAVFTAPATAGATPTMLAAGPPLDNPVSIAISDDDATLYVADFAADGAMPDRLPAPPAIGDLARGQILVLPTAGGGMATRLMVTGGLVGPSGIAVDGANLIVTGTLQAASGALSPAVFTVPAAGGAATPIVMDAMLVTPTDVTVGTTGTFYTFDTGNGLASGRIATVTTGVAFGLSALVGSFPAGVAASRNGMNLLVAGWTAGMPNRLTYVAADGSSPMPIASTDLVSPTGIGRAHAAPVYAVADEGVGAGGQPTPPNTAPNTGAVFLVR